MGAPRAVRAVLPVLSLVSFVVMIIFNIAAATGFTKGLFRNTTGAISGRYSLGVTPAGWTFSIWGFIYAWNALWVAHALSALCRRGQEGPLYAEASATPPAFHLIWLLNNAINVAWLFLWDAELFIPSLIFLAFVPFTLYLMLALSYRSVQLLLKTIAPRELWLTRILAHNGLAMYATWTTIATLLNLGVVLRYDGGVSGSATDSAVLAILALEVLTWFVLEVAVLERHVRYTLTVYPVVIVALSGSVSQNYDTESPSGNDVFTVVLLGVTCALLVARLALAAWRHAAQPRGVAGIPGGAAETSSVQL
ncbi:uncharacterized protein LOC144723244 [Lampetra planeri]